MQIAADDILEIAMEQKATVVPYEASAALSVLLLRDHSMLMAHFVVVSVRHSRFADQIRAAGRPSNGSAALGDMPRQ